MFWIAALAMMLLAACAAAWPLLRRRRVVADVDSDAERAVLRAALAENEGDRAAGRIGGAEADAARAEIGRRLLRLERERGEAPAAPVRRLAPVPLAMALVVPLGAAGLYAGVGSPGSPDLPVVARLPEPVAADEARELIARAEAHLAENPGDARGWALIAPVYRSMGEFDRAVDAFNRALAGLAGPDRSYALAELSELMVMRENGRVNPIVRQMLTEAMQIDPANDKAGFYLALYAEQTGDRDVALAAWRGLIDRYGLARPAWLPVAERKVAALEAGTPLTLASGPRVGATSAATAAEPAPPGFPPGPTQEDIEASAAMAPVDRLAMIEGMVTSLAERLETEPGDAEGWERLVRSYVVLGRRDDARAALDRAAATLGERGAAGVASLRAELGLEPGAPTMEDASDG